MEMSAPWLKYYGNVPYTLDYPDCSMEELVRRASEKYPDLCAYDFLGVRTSYREFANKIDTCAMALAAAGIREAERVTICMPNVPQAVIMFYAVNRIGAVANMVHPLSAVEEIAFFLNTSGSSAALTLDQFYHKFEAVADKINIKTLIVTGIDDELSGVQKYGYRMTQGRKIKKAPTGGNVVRWNDFLKAGKAYSGEYLREKRGDDVAAILYSGGTTGTTKGILLTNLNFNALAMQTAAAGDCVIAGHKMLTIMPIFHGFGLGVCVHAMFISGVSGVLVPQFSLKSYAKLLKKHRPHYIAGVPTLYEALLRMDDIGNLDMSQLEGMFCGGDSLTIELKRKVDAFLQAHGASIQIREGYGTTECVTASCLTPKDFHREGSIGIPYPDMFYKITDPETLEAVPYGETGEICIYGPTVMKGYLDNPEEMALTLKEHADGRVWLHTGDLGEMDEDGFVYFRQRIKRIIISSGYSIYPSQIENSIEAHEAVLVSCVIGVPDDYKMQRLKAFIVLRDGMEPTEELKASIIEHCKRHIAKYAMPSEFEYRSDLPKTLVGKVAYMVLEQEEAEKTGK